MNPSDAVKGAMYRIQVVIPGVFNTPRESCMKLIDITTDKLNGEKILVFSARPRLGTQEIHAKYITEIEIQTDDALVYVNWKPIPGGKPAKRNTWPYAR